SAIDTWRTVFLSRDPRVAGQVEPVGRELRNLVWKPLLPYLKGAKTVVLCPDQALGRVAFSALPGRKSGTYLIEDHRLACISVPQLLPALFRESSREQDRANGALLIGDVDYERSNSAAAEFQARLRGAEDLFQDVAFAPLAETAGEIAGIRDLFLEFHEMDSDAVRMLQKQQATESAFRDFAGQYSTLHIATHGFFADPSKKSVQQYAEEEDSRTRSGLFAQNDLPSNYVRGFYPGMLSGLALAGANRAPESEGQDDGILTADEISFLRLEGVDLVVLSACETGLGPVAGGEGLLGVQRAFQVSGARSVVASLWNVDDIATRRLMERFYRNLWERKLSKLDALREAQLWMLNNPDSISGADRGTLVRLKKPARETPTKPGKLATRTDPKFWAAFVLSGDWR
ncbi:MAG: CHAT domain-containing protein, partial [Planctomycetaceae bacterium]